MINKLAAAVMVPRQGYTCGAIRAGDDLFLP